MLTLEQTFFSCLLLAFLTSNSADFFLAKRGAMIAQPMGICKTVRILHSTNSIIRSNGKHCKIHSQIAV